MPNPELQYCRLKITTTFELVFTPELELNLLEGGGGLHDPVAAILGDLHHRGGGGGCLQPLSSSNARTF